MTKLNSLLPVLCLMMLPLNAMAQDKPDTVLAINLEIPAAKEQRYHAPYVALWLETLDGTAVTTIEVWYTRDRWLPEVGLWWRKLGSWGSQNYDSVTGATRRPGNYNIEWDGRDASGNKVAPGEYWLWTEIAREHGGDERLKLKVDLSAPGSEGSIKGSSEIGTIRFRVI